MILTNDTVQSASQPRQNLGLRPETPVSQECFCLNTSRDKIFTICLGNYIF